MQPAKICKEKDYAEWEVQRFAGKQSVYVCFHLLPSMRLNERQYEYEAMDRSKAEAVARIFNNKINRFCYGNAYQRHEKRLLVTASVHDLPDWHLHFLVEVPHHKTIEEIDTFIQDFAKANRWVKPSKKGVYCEPTRSLERASKYNARFGPDSIIFI